MAIDDVKLLSFWASPFAVRARLALEAKGVNYELLEENLLQEKSKNLLEANPVSKKVPVLLHNGKAILESLIIVLYIDETWPEDGTRPGFLSRDPFNRATAHFWATFIDKKVFDPILGVMRAKVEDKNAAVTELYRNFLTLEEGFVKLGANPFLNGTTIGYADIALAPLAYMLPGTADLLGIKIPTVEEAPRFHEFLGAIREHPAAKVALPDQEKHAAYYIKPLLERSAARRDCSRRQYLNECNALNKDKISGILGRNEA